MPVLHVRDIIKAYGGLRPFRLAALDVEPGELVVLGGMDRQSAIVLTDLLTGTTLPEGDGSIAVDGLATSAVAGQEDWLAFLDRFGLVNDRVVLLDDLTVAANLAVPLTLEVDPVPPDIRRAVESVAEEVGIEPALLDRGLHDVSPMTRGRVRLGRALAQDPRVLLVEHPTVELTEQGDVVAVFDSLRRVVEHRKLAAVVMVADPRVPADKATRFLRWDAASGDLAERRGWRRWFA
jgi:peptide/nickel transport system ATP-binding protein